MRAIKFRAFYKGDIEGWEHNGNARMIYDIQNAYDGTGFDDPEGRFGWVSCFSDFMDDEKMSVMQYTGLVDKNGTDIYEGDIIKYVYRKPMLPELYVVKDMTNYHDMRILEKIISKPLSAIEVIGNIYEDKHLLD